MQEKEDLTQRHRLPLMLKLGYGLGSVPFGVKDAGLKFFLLLYYNQVLGLSASWVGAASAVALAADAVLDPILGQWSDTLHSRWGRRHPFMYLSALPIALCYGLLWDPPAGLSPNQLALYLLGMVVLVRALISFYEVPNSALMAELTDDYDERTAVVGWRLLFGWAGGLGMVVLALVAFLRPDADHATGQLVAAGYVEYGWASGIIMLATSLASSLATHRRIPLLQAPPPRRPFDLKRSLGEIRQSLSNRSLQSLLLVILFANLAGGLSATLGFYYNTYFWLLSNEQSLLLVFGLFVGTIFALPLSAALSKRWDKKPVTIALVLLAIPIGPLPQLLRLIDWFPANGAPGLLGWLFVHAAIGNMLTIAVTILIIAMMTDTVEASQLATGRRSEGLLLAVTSFVTKCATGLGLAMSGALIDLIGFPVKAQPGTIDPAVLHNLVLAYTPLTTVLFLVMLGFLSAYRIDRAAHEANLERLAAGEAPPWVAGGAEAIDPY
jgi:Na+/melibiose symporter-like transporter